MRLPEPRLLPPLLLLLSGAAAVLPPRLLARTLTDLLRAASDACEALPLEKLSSEAAVPALGVLAYSRGGSERLALSAAHERAFAPGAELPLYVAGWRNAPADRSTRALVAALLHRAPLVLALDTAPSFSRGYVSSCVQVDGVARQIYLFLKKLHGRGFPMSQVHIVGFSLGAHVAGLVGRSLNKKLNVTLGKITGLDPARPCFGRGARRLRRRDARRVLVLHSSPGAVGLAAPLGHLDVYLNGLSAPQPPCRARPLPLDCDHAQAWRLFAASAGGAPLPGRRCRSWQELERGACGGERAEVGYGAAADTAGLYIYRWPDTERALSLYDPFDIATWFDR